MRQFDVAIVGAGHGGAHAAILLRQLGFAGSIGLIGAEPELPYERPPLSKDYLVGEKPFERMLIRPPDFWSGRDISILTGRRIVSVDPAKRTLAGDTGETFGFNRLIWAAGGVPRRLSCLGADLAGVHVVRCRAEVDAIRSELGPARRVAVVGGGYVGLETAAALRKLGKEVVLVEAMDRLLSRVAAEPVGRFFEAEHRAQGVDLRLSASVDAIEGTAGRASGLRLAGGDRIAADMVIVGIGIDAADAPLRAAGALCGNGVLVDSFCGTSLEGIYSVGDCAAHENRFAGGARIRLESVQNAHDMAMTAVKAILGSPEPYAATPWFWSNQYDLKLQTVGLSHGYDAMLVRGEPASRSFSLVYFRDGRVAALDCVNCVKDYVQGRRLVEAGASPDPLRLADSSVPLKDLA